MLEYSWMLIFVTATGMLTITELETKEQCVSAVAGMVELDTVGIRGKFACIPKPYFTKEAAADRIADSLCGALAKLNIRGEKCND